MVTKKVIFRKLSKGQPDRLPFTFILFFPLILIENYDKLTVSVKQCGRLLILFCHNFLEDKVPYHFSLLQLPLGAILRKSLILLLAHVHDHVLVANHFFIFLFSHKKASLFSRDFVPLCSFPCARLRLALKRRG